MKNRKTFKNTKPKKPKPINLQKACLKWLNDRGYFASKVYMDGAMLILAIKAGKTYAFCAGKDSKESNQIMADMDRALAHTAHIQNISDLEAFLMSD